MCRGEVVRRLRRRVHNQIGRQILHKFPDSGTVTNIHLVVAKIWNGVLKPALIPARVTFRAKKCGALVVVQPLDLESVPRKIRTNLRTNQPVGTGD